MSSHAVILLNLRAVITTADGEEIEFLDVVQYVASWALNTIPMASILVAVGRNVDDNSLATIHTAVQKLKTRLLAQIYFTGTVLDMEQALPGVNSGDEIKIFEGKVVGTGWQRTQSGAHFTIHIMHWIGDLNNGSAASASLSPGSAGDLCYPAIFPAIGLSTVSPQATPLPSWVPGLAATAINTGSFADMWGNILLPFMQAIASDDPFDRALNGTGIGGDPDTIIALTKMLPSPDGQPLNLNLSGADATVLADAMRIALINEIGGNWINTTLWGKLIGEWAPAYWFSVVPRVDDALIVPFTGGLQGAPWAVIGDEDYVSCDMNAQLHQLLRAVGIVYPIETSTSFDLNVGLPQSSRSGLLGVFRPATTTRGMILYKDAPKWLSNPMTVHMMSFFAEGIDGSPIATSMDERGVGQGPNPPRDFDNNLKQLKSIASSYAHQWYILEFLKGRVGEVAGKLRFDIAPGSNVLVVAGGAANVPAAASVTEDMFATVIGVSYVINAQAQRAGTAFSLAHIRTATENTSPDTSIATPPLYKNGWPGAMLVPSAPGPEQDEE